MNEIGYQVFSHQAMMTVDVEDWFQVENLKPVVQRESWATRELRVVQNTERILQLLADRNQKCTFFVLGWVAEKVPALVRDIAKAGHEIASHGYGHDLLYHLNDQTFRSDTERSKNFLEDLTGQEVFGYRAPSFSITDWAIPILRELGFTYDSSVFSSVAHDRYGRLTGMNRCHSICEIFPNFFEVPVSCLSIGRYGLPWGGGGYFRLIPYTVFKIGIQRIISSGRPYVFYIHPWEIDPQQPRPEGLKLSYSFRHYVNLDKCELRLKSLLRDFGWSTINSILKPDYVPFKSRAFVDDERSIGIARAGNSECR